MKFSEVYESVSLKTKDNNGEIQLVNRQDVHAYIDKIQNKFSIENMSRVLDNIVKTVSKFFDKYTNYYNYIDEDITGYFAYKTAENLLSYYDNDEVRPSVIEIELKHVLDSSPAWKQFLKIWKK
jgi:hypothetical protein